MAVNLSIKNVPNVLAEKLRARAERNHRSLQGELMAIVENAVASDGATGEGARAAIKRGTKTMEQIAAEHRARYPEPITGRPRSTDIIRKLRDSR